MLAPAQWKRLVLDVEAKTAIFEDIEDKVREYIGGKGLNLDYLDGVNRDKDVVVIATGPFVGTGFPCASFSYISRFHGELNYAVTSSFGGHFGPAMRMAGLIQIVIKGKSKNMRYIIIDDDKVSFHEASSLRDKSALLTDTSIREQHADADIETIAIGNPPEELANHAVLFSSGTWPINRFGFGGAFLEKGLKAIGIRGSKAFHSKDKDLFLGYLSTQFRKITEDLSLRTVRKEGSLAFLTRKNMLGFPSTIPDDISGSQYSRRFERGSEACSACPIGCGRFSTVDGAPPSSGPLVEEVLFLAANMKSKKWSEILTEAFRMRRESLDPMILFTEDRSRLSAMHRIGLEERYVSMKFKGLPLCMDPRACAGLGLYYTFTIQDYDYFSITKEIDPAGEEDHGAFLKNAMVTKALSDMLGICPLPVSHIPAITPADLHQGYAIITGKEAPLEEKAKRLIDRERKMGGFSRQQDLLDDGAFGTDIKSGPGAGQSISGSSWNKRLDGFYETMEWDAEGRPKE
jgi:aldehyde:ferredoxin oxidoreductase